MSANDLSTSVIFPVGEKLESDKFNGTVWLKMLTPFGTDCPIGNVTFERRDAATAGTSTQVARSCL